MSYPTIRFTRSLRIAFMVVLILLFFLISPLILLYTAGYRYNTKTGQISETGVVNLDLEPRDATVQFNHITLHGSMPIRLSNRTPGQYELVVTKPGFHTLKKTVEVRSKQTTYIRDISLLKDNLPTSLLPITSADYSFQTLSSDGKYFMKAEPTDKKNIYLVEITDLETQQVQRTRTITSEHKPIITWSPTGVSALVVGEQGGRAHYDIFFMEEKNYHEFLSSTTSTPSYQWSEEKANELFIEDGAVIFSVSKKGIQKKQAHRFSPWYIDKKQTLWEFDANTKTLTHYMEQGVSSTHHISESLTEIIVIRDTHVLGKNVRGLIIVPFSDVTQVKQIPANNIRYYNEPDGWIAWSKSEIWQIKNEETTLLTRIGQPIQEVYPLDDLGTLLVDTGNKLLAYHPYFFPMQPLFEHGEVTTKGVNQKNRTTYFVARIGNQTNLYTLVY